MQTPGRIDRREFIVRTAAFGGGMALSIAFARPAAAGVREHATQPLASESFELSPWLLIAPDDTVTVRVAGTESGNGSMTQAPMTVAEELRCDWLKVRPEIASLNRDLRENKVYSTAGGFVATFAGRATVPERIALYLQVGASARERLKAAAAEAWKVSAGEIEAENSVLTHKPSGRKLRYGEVAARAAGIQLSQEPAPKPQSEWTFLGKSTPAKLGNPLIVNGGAVFGIDVQLPDMVYAALMQAPVQGGKLVRYDAAAVSNMPGVRAVVVVDPDEPRKPVKAMLPPSDNAPQSGIAVIADHYWQARKALEALPVEWSDGPGAQWKDVDQLYKVAHEELDREPEKIERNEGDVLKALSEARKPVAATYRTPFCDHATLEPLNGTALFTPGRVDVWHPTALALQAFLTVVEEAGVAGVAPENVHLHQTLVGGSFGRRLLGDDVRMVAAVARKYPGRPVKVIWTREESMRQGRYRTLQSVRFDAALGENGLPTALRARVAQHNWGLNGLIDSAYVNLYTIPNVRIEKRLIPAVHLRTGAYRAPGYNSHAFFLESFIDECAQAAGIDPLIYRLELLDKYPDPGWKKCLNEVAEKSGWGKPLPKGQGQGIAICNWGSDGKPQAGTTVAAVATVEVSRAGDLIVQRLDLAFDCGRMLNRDAVLTQLHGGMIFGLNMCLNEELTLQNGRIVEGNFDQYPILRMVDVPRNIHVHFGGLSGHDRFSEVGEPPTGVVAPAIANAIYRATGKRVRAMPFRKQDLRWT